MITVKCPKCGAETELDEKRAESVVCKHCKTVISLEKAAPEKYKELIEKREKTEQRYKNILKDYESGNDAPLKNAMHKVISNTDTSDFNIDRWFDFIFNAVNIGIAKKDTGNLEILKAHARRFDDAYSDYNAGDRRLYDSLVFLHPEILSESEWKVEFEKARQSQADLTLLQNNILKCIREKKDPRLIISVLNVLIGSAEDFKDIGEEFLNSILDDEELAAKILNVSFFKKAKGAAFAKRLRKYVSSTFKDAEVILKDTLVWNNAERVFKAKKKKLIITVASVIAAAAIGVTSLLIYLSSADKDTIRLDGAKENPIIEMVYGEDPKLSGYTLIFTRRDGTEERVAVTPNMLSGFDPEKLGVQNARVTYKGQSFDVKIEVKATRLSAPSGVTVSENRLIWDRVANAAGYYIYFSKTQGSAGEAKYATVDDAEGNAALVYDLTQVNDMGNTFYATVIAFGASDKYTDSEGSEAKEIKKLTAPSNITYDLVSGKITWSAVDGASHYTLLINGETVQNVSQNEISRSFESGDLEITVTAHPEDKSVIISKASVTLHKLSPAESISYVGNTIKWDSSEGNRYNISITKSGESEPKKSASMHAAKSLDVKDLEEGIYTVKIEVASNSTTDVTSNVTELDIYIGGRIAVSGDGNVSWSYLGGKTSYDVYLDGKKETLTSDSNGYFNISAGEHTLYVVARDGNGKETLSETVTLKKLASPTLSVSKNQTLLAAGLTANHKFTLKDEEITDDTYTNIFATKCAEAGDHTVKAQNLANGAYEISSEVATLTVKRLSVPTLSVSGGELYVNGAIYNAEEHQLSVDGATASTVTPGNHHTVKVKLKAKNENELDSGYSEELTVTKLQAPTLTYDKTTNTLTCTPTPENATLKYYNSKNGNKTEWNGDVSSLSGSNEITAKFTTDAENTLNSESSTAVSIVRSNVKIDKISVTDTSITVKLSGGEKDLDFKISVSWSSEGKSQKTFKFKGSEMSCTLTKDTTAETSAVVTVTILASDGSTVDTITQNWYK